MLYPGQKIQAFGKTGRIHHISSVVAELEDGEGTVRWTHLYPEDFTAEPDLPLDLLDKVADYLYHSTPCGTIGDAIENAKAVLSLVLNYGDKEAN